MQKMAFAFLLFTLVKRLMKNVEKACMFGNKSTVINFLTNSYFMVKPFVVAAHVKPFL